MLADQSKFRLNTQWRPNLSVETSRQNEQYLESTNSERKEPFWKRVNNYGRGYILHWLCVQIYTYLRTEMQIWKNTRDQCSPFSYSRVTRTCKIFCLLLKTLSNVSPFSGALSYTRLGPFPGRDEWGDCLGSDLKRGVE